LASGTRLDLTGGDSLRDLNTCSRGQQVALACCDARERLFHPWNWRRHPPAPCDHKTSSLDLPACAQFAPLETIAGVAFRRTSARSDAFVMGFMAQRLPFIVTRTCRFYFGALQSQVGLPSKAEQTE
jgi:hypothetical protein